jgi:hypothetical protein
MLVVVRRSPLALSSSLLMMAAIPVLATSALLACQRSDPPPGSPAEVAPCPEDAGTELPRELACCLIQARTGEDAQICLSKADGGH